MKKKYVLKKNHQFQKIIGSGKYFMSRSLVVYFSSNKLDAPRYGISISKKFANAVYRNYYKRKVRNILREFRNISPFDVVLILRKPFLALSYNKMFLEISKLLKKVNDAKQ